MVWFCVRGESEKVQVDAKGRPKRRSAAPVNCSVLLDDEGDKPSNDLDREEQELESSEDSGPQHKQVNINNNNWATREMMLATTWVKKI